MKDTAEAPARQLQSLTSSSQNQTIRLPLPVGFGLCRRKGGCVYAFNAPYRKVAHEQDRDSAETHA